MMKSNTFWCLSALVAMLFACSAPLSAQEKDNDWSQEEACPGWNNPLNFTDGNNQFFYSGRAGKKKGSSAHAAPSPMNGGELGFHYNNGPFENAPIILANQLGTYVIDGNYDCASFPTGHAQNIGFAIYDTNTQVTGHPKNRDPNTGDLLPYVPTHFNTYDTTPGVVNTRLTNSIRIGDAKGNTNATALYYQMHVNGDNAMLYIYYACVIESPASGSSTTVHGNECDPAFIIRVMKKNASGDWIQANPNNPTSNVPNDSLAYMITSTPAAGQGWTTQGYGTFGDIQLNQTGQGAWHIYTGGSSAAGGGASYGSYKIMWKEWDKVALNLSPLYGEDVRIEVMVSDCCMTQHFAYGYVCGECRPMDIPSTGCPTGRSTDVTSLVAPRGLRSYVWEASDYGVSNPPFLTQAGYEYDYYTFRRLPQGSDSTEAANAHIYHVQANDFRYTRRRVGGVDQICNEVGSQQTFRCKMISALDPAKPFVSYMYANVTNIKPTMIIDSLSMCGGDVRLWNQSNVPGGQTEVDMPSTSWKFYNTPNPTALSTPLFTMTGDSAAAHFDNDSLRYVLVRSNAMVDPGTPECYSEAVYTIRPKMNPKAGMTISQRILCDTAQTTIFDTTSNVTYRRWSFLADTASEGNDSTMVVYTEGEATAQNQSVTRSFSHSKEPIELYVRNGLFYSPRTDQTEIIWCADTAYDTVKVFTHPELEVTGDTIVCRGSTTNATVRAVDDTAGTFTYQWSKTLGNVTGGLPAGPTLQVEPSSAVETYYVLVRTPEQCEAWDSIRVYLITPTMTMIPNDGTICPGDTVTLIGGNAAYYTWSADPVDSTLVNDTADMVLVTPEENTVYTMVGHGTNDCDAAPLTKSVTVKPLPIPHVSYEPAIVDVDDPTLMLRNTSENSVGAVWTFANDETAKGNEVTHTFIEATGSDSVYVTLSPYNELNCSVDYRFGILVALYNVWFPNVFTPNSEDENATFHMYANMPYERFHLYIYNRRGEVVFETTDPMFSWDGTCNGVKCPQGAYVYVCRYRKPGMLTLAEQRGTVTLVR